jgi:hypothetical protein
MTSIIDLMPASIGLKRIVIDLIVFISLIVILVLYPCKMSKQPHQSQQEVLVGKTTRPSKLKGE